jgi:hypothetical protein
MATTKDLERKAERVRERLSDRLSDLRYHASPSTVVTDLLGINPRELADDLMPALVKQARNNPIAFSLIAAGVGWLIFSEIREPLANLARRDTPRRQTRSRRARKRGAKSARERKS